MYVPSTIMVGTPVILSCFANLMLLLILCSTVNEFKYCKVTSGATPNLDKKSWIALGFCKKFPYL